MCPREHGALGERTPLHPRSVGNIFALRTASRQIVKPSGSVACPPSACVHRGSPQPWCFATQVETCQRSERETFGGCATGGRYLTNSRCGPPRRGKPACGSAAFSMTRVPSSVQPRLASTAPRAGEGTGFSHCIWNFFYVVEHSVGPICPLLFHSLGSVCDNSSFFMGFEAIIRS